MLYALRGLVAATLTLVLPQRGSRLSGTRPSFFDQTAASSTRPGFGIQAVSVPKDPRRGPNGLPLLDLPMLPGPGSLILGA